MIQIKQKNNLLFAVLLVLTGFVYLPITADAKIIEKIVINQDLHAPNTSAFNHFSASVAISNDILAIGTPYDDSSWNDSGAVFLYVKKDEEWSLKKKIQPRQLHENGNFGASIVLDGDLLIVGEPGSGDEQQGYVYVFRKNSGGNHNWGQIKQISRPEDCLYNTRDGFGTSIAAQTGTLMIGAPTACKNRDQWYETQGAVYVYTDYGNTFIKKLTAHNGEEDDLFGSTVALCNGYGFVGAPYVDNGSLRTDAGAVYLYSRKKEWQLQKYFNPPETLENSYFGSSISCSNNIAAIGAPAKSSSYGNDEQKGSVYLFNKNKEGAEKWGLTDILQEEDYSNQDKERNNHFGTSLFITDDTLIVGFGESKKNDSDSEPMAQIFNLQNGHWQPLQLLTLSTDPDCDTSSWDKGFQVATNGSTFIIGDMESETDIQSCNTGSSVARIYRREYFQPVITPFADLLLRKE